MSLSRSLRPVLRSAAGRVACLVCVLALAPLAHARSGPKLSVEERAERSERVVLARVTALRTEPLRRDSRFVVTVATLEVEEDWKGSGERTVEVRQLGGATGAWKADVVDAARFELGERGVFFLRCPAGTCSLFGAADAKLRVLEQGKRRLVLVPDGPALREHEVVSIRDAVKRGVKGPGTRAGGPTPIEAKPSKRGGAHAR